MKRAGILFVLIGTALTVAVTLDARRQAPSLTTLVTSYSQGQYDEAVRQAAAIDDLGPVRVRWVQHVPAWIRSDPALAGQRRAAAAAFLLELTHARLESDWGRLDDLIEFTCVDLRTGNPVSPFELAWHRASIALAGRARARLWLLGEYAQLPHQPPRRRAPSQRPDPNPKHLVHALERFPDDPHLRLARIVAWTWGRDQEPVRNVRRSELANATARLLLEALMALRPLEDEPTVGPEALVRIAQVHFSVGDHAAALGTLERAKSRDASQAIRYLSFFLAGRTLEALGRPDEALKQYTQALEVLPGAESATIAVASLQFVHDDRERAVSLLSEAFAKPISSADPWRLVGYGSFMHWPELKRALRAELPR